MGKTIKQNASKKLEQNTSKTIEQNASKKLKNASKRFLTCLDNILAETKQMATLLGKSIIRNRMIGT